MVVKVLVTNLCMTMCYNYMNLYMHQQTVYDMCIPWNLSLLLTMVDLKCLRLKASTQQ